MMTDIEISSWSLSITSTPFSKGKKEKNLRVGREDFQLSIFFLSLTACTIDTGYTMFLVTHVLDK